ncbi:MAG: tyrosine--tRNA ligase [Candidatus Enterosoma sp.]|nr:tyrosine--tRNA ligase [Bacilli bacterium]MDY5650367.1 tyrosine--tRNA ligase [Candidatus Enterosoma sp.]
MDIIEDLERRGLLDNFSNKEKIKELFKEKQTIYCGFDPSFKSLQLGNYIMITILKRLQKAGHKIIAVLGGATGMIGDPSGRNSERSFQDENTLFENAKAIKNQLAKYIDTSDPEKGIIVNNYDWWSKINTISFLRDYGKMIQINYMLDKETVKRRLDTGISFTEFSYMLLQSGDFQKLYDDYHCTIQIGGGDQWGNLTCALDFVKKTREESRDQCEVFSVKLITDSQGKKFGKSENGALYLDPELTSPYHIYQYFMNVSDQEVEKYLKIFDDRDIAEIEKIVSEHMAHPEFRTGQKELARLLVTMIHGKRQAERCKLMSEALFKDDFSSLEEDDLKQLTDGLCVFNASEDISLQDALVNCKLASSKREARDFIKNGACKINGNKQNDLEKVITKEDCLNGGYIFLKRGKKNYAVIKY